MIPDGDREKTRDIAIRAISRASFMQWVPFFPISERLNVFIAGSLLALMAVPTIFALAEDPLRNVPRVFKEASRFGSSSTNGTGYCFRIIARQES